MIIDPGLINPFIRKRYYTIVLLNTAISICICVKMISNQILMKIASLGGFITASTGYAFHYRIQHDIKKSESYKDAISIFYAHKKAVTYLGEPITLGRITYGDEQKILKPKMKYKWFKVSLTGSNTKAKLYYEVILEHGIENKYEISKIEITFDNIPGKIFVIKDCEINE